MDRKRPGGLQCGFATPSTTLTLLIKPLLEIQPVSFVSVHLRCVGQRREVLQVMNDCTKYRHMASQLCSMHP